AQFMLDLGKPRVVGRIDFWPAAAPYEVEVPSFGFPQEISVKVSDDPDFKTGKQLNFQSFRGKLLSVTGEGINARYVHITMEGLDEYKGMPILGLGEISVSRGDRAASVGCKVVAQGIPDRCQDQLALLVDGISRQRRILPQGEWIRGLAQRRPLDRRLAVVERELELARTAWQHIKQRSIIWMGIILSMGLIGGLVVQQRMRKRGIAKLKGRIARDLHDDVGSNLGSISLTAEQLKHVVVDAEVKEELCDLSLMARDSGILPSTVNINVRRVGSRVADATTVIYSCGDRRKW
ncbi:MAG: histidine kinase dimerization/phosphoacceptor domain-containing protein, partial [Verrucomicrobia bacterium]|nr:histidine kinase dimerization/phosphoacceptor domain-containing protein [Verrucomicrobiota bacterium]